MAACGHERIADDAGCRILLPAVMALLTVGSRDKAWGPWAALLLIMLALLSSVEILIFALAPWGSCLLLDRCGGLAAPVRHVGRARWPFGRDRATCALRDCRPVDWRRRGRSTVFQPVPRVRAGRGLYPSVPFGRTMRYGFRSALRLHHNGRGRSARLRGEGPPSSSIVFFPSRSWPGSAGQLHGRLRKPPERSPACCRRGGDRHRRRVREARRSGAGAAALPWVMAGASRSSSPTASSTSCGRPTRAAPFIDLAPMPFGGGLSARRGRARHLACTAHRAARSAHRSVSGSRTTATVSLSRKSSPCFQAGARRQYRRHAGRSLAAHSADADPAIGITAFMYTGQRTPVGIRPGERRRVAAPDGSDPAAGCRDTLGGTLIIAPTGLTNGPRRTRQYWNDCRNDAI